MHRNRLDVEHDLCLSLSKITPRFQKFVETKQAHFLPTADIKLLKHIFIVVKNIFLQTVHTLGSRILAYLIFFKLGSLLEKFGDH